MKKIVTVMMALVPFIGCAQITPRTHVKRHLPSPSKSIKRVAIGDTCFVSSGNLALRAKPDQSSVVSIYLRHNAKLVVRKILANQWILVDYYNQDVGVDGYVPLNCISSAKTP